MIHLRGLVAAGVLLGATLLAPVPAQAQIDRTRAWELGLSVGRGSPFYVYNEWITRAPELLPNGDTISGIRTRYSEYAEEPFVASGHLMFRHGGRQWLALRGGFGSSGSRAHYSGGDAEQDFERSVRWTEIGLIGGIALFDTPRAINPHLYAGPLWSSWRIDTRGTGRDVLGSIRTADGRQAGKVEWNDRDWTAIGGIVGTELHVRLGSSLTAKLTFEQRYAPVKVYRLGRADQADIRAGTGHIVTIGYRSYSAYPASFTIGFNWTAHRFNALDEGAEALAAHRARVEAGTAQPATSWSETLPADAREPLERGDTAAAIAALDRRLKAEPQNNEVAGALGVLLAESASAVESDFLGRMRAERLLLQALRPNPRNPRLLLALAVLMEKRGYTVDVRRVTGRALMATVTQPGVLTPEEIAEAFFRRGQSYERTVLDYEGLRHLIESPGGLHSETCNDAGPFCVNWERPLTFYRAMKSFPDMSEIAGEKRLEMAIEYDRATQLAPAHAGAHRGLLAAYARAGDWPAFLAQATRYADAAPDEPWARIFLVAGQYWNGETVSDSVARASVAALAEADRRIFEDVSPLLQRGEERRFFAGIADSARSAQLAAYWNAADPLLLTRTNEREMEHYGRVALAELLFGEPQSGRRGWETDRGQILVRYGRPREVWQVAVGGNDQSLRYIFWNYDPNEPSFMFSKSLGRLTTRHLPTSGTVAEQGERIRPTTFQPVFRHAGPVPHQVARFRRDARTFDVEIFAEAPVDSLRLAATDSLRTGAFLLRGGDNARLGEDSRAGTAADPRRAYRFVVPPGVYRYALEAMRTDGTAAATTREELVVGAYSASRLQLSDVLLARWVEARTGDPRTHRDLNYEGMACLRVPDEGALGVVFELYGLQVTDATARYRVEIETGEGAPRNIAVKLLRGVRDLVTDREQGKLSFVREIASSDGNAVEYFDLELPPEMPKDPVITITVTDLDSGERVVGSRKLGTGKCGA